MFGAYKKHASLSYGFEKKNLAVNLCTNNFKNPPNHY